MEYLILHNDSVKIWCKSKHVPGKYRRKWEWVFFFWLQCTWQIARLMMFQGSQRQFAAMVTTTAAFTSLHSPSEFHAWYISYHLLLTLLFYLFITVLRNSVICWSENKGSWWTEMNCPTYFLISMAVCLHWAVSKMTAAVAECQSMNDVWLEICRYVVLPFLTSISSSVVTVSRVHRWGSRRLVVLCAL